MAKAWRVVPVEGWQAHHARFARAGTRGAAETTSRIWQPGAGGRRCSRGTHYEYGLR